MEITEFLSWEFLATFGGASVATGLVVQFTKAWVSKVIPTEMWTYIVALVIMLVSAFFTGALTLSYGVLCVLNAMIVAMATKGGYDTVTSVMKKNK